MKKILLIFLLPISLIFSSGSAKKTEHVLTICAIFQNEAPFLKQWIDFHHQAIGVSQFYLYNNDSTDNFLEVLSPYISQGLVQLIEWPTIPQNAIFHVDDYLYCPYQIAAYRDCLKNRAYNQADWVAMIDIDEYIVPTRNVKSFYHLLEECKRNSVGSIKIQWKTFGTSGVCHLNPGERLIEKLIKRAPDNHVIDLNNVKSIHQPKATANHCMVHETCQVEEGYQIAKVPRSLCRIHHYWSGTEERCSEKRRFRSVKEKKKYLNQLNSVEDFSIYPYLDYLSPLDS